MRRDAAKNRDQAAPSLAIESRALRELCFRLLGVGGDAHRPAVLIGAGKGLVARDEAQACALEIGAVMAVDKRAGKERQVGGVEVVSETGKRDVLGADCASNLGC